VIGEHPECGDAADPEMGIELEFLATASRRPFAGRDEKWKLMLPKK